MENDTVLAITKPQLVKINRSLNDYVHLKKLNVNLQMDLVVSDSLINYWKQTSLLKEEIISLEIQKFETAQVAMTGLQESLKQQKKKSRKTIIGVGIGGTLIGFILGVLLK